MESRVRRIIGFLAGFLVLGSMLWVNMGEAEIEFIHKEGKLYVKAKGEVRILEDSETKERRYALELEEGQIYILVGEFSKKLEQLEGELVEVEGLLQPRIEFKEKRIPSMEVERVEKVKGR